MNINYINFDNTTMYHDDKVPYISCREFDKIDFIKHGFSTKLGGVSKGEYESMNLSFTRGDDEVLVNKNYELIAGSMGIRTENMVFTKQTHTTNVIAVTKKDCKKCFEDVDGFVTNEPGVVLVTSHADCVPLYFVDMKMKAIGLSHAGWKGTVNNIAAETINLMAEQYDSSPSDIKVFIGPSICRSCYEIGEDVAELFAKAYGDKVFTDILYPQDNGKYHLDLHKANWHNLTTAGIPAENIITTDICTSCNSEFLFSHRASKGRRGGMCAFLEILYKAKIC